VELRDDRPAQLLNDEHSELRWVSAREMRDLQPVFVEDVALFERLTSETCEDAGASES